MPLPKARPGNYCMKRLLGDDTALKGAALYLEQVIAECRDVVRVADMGSTSSCSCSPAGFPSDAASFDSQLVSPSSSLSSWGGSLSEDTHSPQTSPDAQPCGCAAQSVSVFDAEEVPSITLLQYLKRWVKHLPIQIVPIAVVYIQRWLESDETRLLTEHNVHRVLLSALILAAKWFSDQPYTLGFYSHTGGVMREELPRLEMAFINGISWECYVSPSDFVSVTLAMHELAQEKTAE